MDKDKKKKLEGKGYIIGSAERFLAEDDEEKEENHQKETG